MNRRRARYVALEGIDGSGKSRLAAALARRYTRRGARVRLVHEPWDPTLGAIAQRKAPVDPFASAILFTLDRWLARPRLERALRTADLVLTDRSFWSTIAYQGSELPQGPRQRLRELSARAVPAPDLVLWLRVPVAIALGRVAARRSRLGPLERHRRLERVARAYQALARGRSWHTLDARRPFAEVVRAAEARIDSMGIRGPPRLALHKRPARRRT